MTTQQTAIEAKKLVDELAEIQKSPMQYAQLDQAIWMKDNLERLQYLMTYVVDDLVNDGFNELELAHEHQVELGAAS